VLTEWNETKRAENIAKHGVDFTAVKTFDWSVALVRGDARHTYGEVRLIAMAPIGARLHVLVCTVERRALRVISPRKANSKEVALYEQEA
jgi:hypothetical protein